MVYDFHHKAHKAHKGRTKTINLFANPSFIINLRILTAEFAETEIILLPALERNSIFASE
jgi:hypothetical protein